MAKAVRVRVSPTAPILNLRDSTAPLGRRSSCRGMGRWQWASGSCSPHLERVRCQLSFEQLDHLPRRQAMADQHSLVRRAVIPCGGDHTFNFCGGHSGDGSGHRLIVCHGMTRPIRCGFALDSLICRLIASASRFSTQGSRSRPLQRGCDGWCGGLCGWWCGWWCGGRCRPDPRPRSNRQVLSGKLLMVPRCWPFYRGVSRCTTAFSGRTGNASRCLTRTPSQMSAVMP